MTITVAYRDHDGFWEASSAQVPALVAGDQQLELVEVLEPISASQVFG